ncbi:MAG: hypothetical protein A2Y39_04590 [Candidatus Delongbacteria bacterium GWF2_40_14]|nr:MAG: hypothetical protein A2Y39_04590 [Candidatus Delongbacteria bacterium GWF2_40_14]
MNILLLDNYDSFTYNLKALLERSITGSEVTVIRNTDPKILTIITDALIISPGPKTWNETGLLRDVFQKIAIEERKPVLGICLGMQFIAGYFGIETGRMNNPVHGSQALIKHSGDPLFDGIPSEFHAARYNSLGLYEEESEELVFTAFEDDSDAVMALRHKILPIAGFQFHPESFMTLHGEKLIKNFWRYYVKNK